MRAFPAYSMQRGAWAMWLPWMGAYCRRMTPYFPTKADAVAAKLEML